MEDIGEIQKSVFCLGGGENGENGQACLGWVERCPVRLAYICTLHRLL